MLVKFSFSQQYMGFMKKVCSTQLTLRTFNTLGFLVLKRWLTFHSEYKYYTFTLSCRFTTLPAPQPLNQNTNPICEKEGKRCEYELPEFHFFQSKMNFWERGYFVFAQNCTKEQKLHRLLLYALPQLIAFFILWALLYA